MKKKKQYSLMFTVLIGVGVLLIGTVAFLYGRDNIFKKFKSEENNFSIKYPPNWEANTNTLGVKVIFFSPLESEFDIFKENVSVVVQDISSDPMSLYKYTKQAIYQTKAVFKGTLVEKVSESTFLDGRAAHKYVYIGKGGQSDLKIMHVWTVVGTNAYQVTYTAISSRFDQYLPKVERMIKSFNIR